MVAKKIKKPHPLNKPCNRCRRCRAQIVYGVASRTGILSRRPDQPKFLPPPTTNPDTKTVFLDLDATLVHADREKPEKYDFMVSFVKKKSGKRKKHYILKRPGVDEFLEFLAKKKLEVVLFTSGLKEYASAVVEKLDPNKVISHCLYRDSCKKIDGSNVKDLSETGRNLEKVVIVDDNPRATMLQPKNAYLIPPFKGDLEDKELWKLIHFLDKYGEFDDLQEAVRDFVLSQNEAGGSGSSPPDAANTIDEKASSSKSSGLEEATK